MREAPNLEIAQQIGPYRVLGPLGAGGMGEVYLAEDIRLGRKVAIKVLGSKQTINDEARGRLLREARAIAGLDHPNICTLYEIGSDQGLDYLVMQYIEGETLAQRMARQPFELRQGLDLAIAAAEGLLYAHSRGIVHRDIKPQNIMMTADGRLKLMDFGVAKDLDSPQAGGDSETALFITQPGIPVGTIEYMAPEQLEGAPADTRSDIFSLGIVIYQLLGQKHPFIHENFSAIMAAILTRDPPPLENLPAPVAPELDRILRKALAKKPAERYQTVRELVGDLRSVWQRLQGHPEWESALAPDVRAKKLKPAAGAGKSPFFWGAAAVGVMAIVLIALAASGVITLGPGHTAQGASSPAPLSLAPKPPEPPSLPNVAGFAGPRTLTYWLEVQGKNPNPRQGGVLHSLGEKILRPLGKESFRSLGEETFHSGDRFRLNLGQSKPAWFYLIDQNSTSPSEFTLLYPTSMRPAEMDLEKLSEIPGPGSLTSGTSAPHGKPGARAFATDWYVFDRSSGNETLWLVGSEMPVVEIELLTRHLNPREKGVIRAAQEVEALRNFLAGHEHDPVESHVEENPKQETIQYQGVLVKGVNLTHR